MNNTGFFIAQLLNISFKIGVSYNLLRWIIITVFHKVHFFCWVAKVKYTETAKVKLLSMLIHYWLIFFLYLCVCVWKKWPYMVVLLKPKPINRASLQVFTSVSDRHLRWRSFLINSPWRGECIWLAKGKLKNRKHRSHSPLWGFCLLSSTHPTHPIGVTAYGWPKASSTIENIDPTHPFGVSGCGCSDWLVFIGL